MGKNTRVDMTNKQFGEWTALYPVGDGYWHCRCSCGKEKDVLGRSLRTNKSLSCGHTKIKHEDLAGKQIGDWSVLSYEGNGEYLCKCLCGRQKMVKTAHLLSGASKSCGHSTTGFNDLTGKQFDGWKVLKYAGDRKWTCQCICGTIRDIDAYSLTSGASTNCGCNMQLHLENKQVGELTVLKRSDKNSNFWVCKCSCGIIKEIRGSALKNETIRSCGCKTTEFKRITMLDRYGDTATARIGKPRDIDVQEACKNKEAMLNLIIETQNALGRVPSLQDMENRMGMVKGHISKYIKDFGLEEYVKIGIFGAAEDSVEDIIKPYNYEIVRNTRKTLPSGKELDIYIPSKKLAIEFNGVYWHSSDMKDKKYHQNKSFECEGLGIRLIHIFEYEWEQDNQREKLIDLLKSILDPNIQRVYARNTQIVELSTREKTEFFNNNHLQNDAKSSINLGLVYNNEIVASMTFGKPRFNSEYEYELIRLAYKRNIVVVGGADRLFKHFISTYNPNTVQSYCDIAKFSGGVYSRLGFKLDTPSITEPNYVWVNKHNLEYYPRYKTMKHKLLALGLGEYGDTENEIMTNLGYTKVYDCGNYRYIWKVVK